MNPLARIVRVVQSLNNSIGPRVLCLLGGHFWAYQNYPSLARRLSLSEDFCIHCGKKRKIR